ncbi:MAG: metallophosphoesterase family protein [Candidatus Omnitrophica bacterium]|nr:metallophosphoesterase family protein [Candidatus Omnitrophota bacterium]
MRIIALSDTHSQLIPPEVLKEIKAADLLIHVGDFCDLDVYYGLKKAQEIRAVYGNMDSLELRSALPKQAVFECGDVRIGIYHGDGGTPGLLERVKAVFKEEKLDIIVFGHTHTPMNEMIDGVLFFNPGSPTDSIRPPYRSYGVLEISGKTIKSEIVRLK